MSDITDYKTLAESLARAIEQAEHKPGQWAKTSQRMGGICCPGEPFDISKPLAREEPWAQFSYKRDSWLAVAAVNALPKLLALIAENERLTTQVRLAGVSAEVTVHQEVGRAITEVLAVTIERDQLKADNDRLRKVITDIGGALEREYWSEYAGLEETRAILDAVLGQGEQSYTIMGIEPTLDTSMGQGEQS